jgi:acyl-CoA hydrolase
MKFVSAEEAVSVIESGNRVFVHTAAAAPQQLIRAMTARSDELTNVEIVHLHTEGEAPYVDPKHRDAFRTNALFVGPNMRQAVADGDADYIPVFLSEIPALFRRRILPVNVALIQVSTPDRHGFCSLGISVDASRAAVETANHVVAQINPNMPRTHGDGQIHVRDIDFAVNVDDPIPTAHAHTMGPVERAIGQHVANLIEDRSCLQMGIGAIPDAVLAALKDHVGLGIHTEMFSDGVIDLVESGVITGEYKTIHPRQIVGSFLVGSRRLYDFVDDNPQVLLRECSYTNDTALIRQLPRMVAINSAIEVDITGQVVADSIGTRQYSGVGGQMDFIRGASLSEGGKPIIALPSVTSRGESRIVPLPKPGAGVVTTRAHVHYLVTEHGVAYLYGKNLRQRAVALIEIAHPDHREALEKEAVGRFKRLRSWGY